jgi:hypothetical protein
MRVPDFPPKPIQPIVRLSHFRDAGYVLVSHCSSGTARQHTLDYDALITERWDLDVDYAFKVAMTCPECGAPGGGMTVLLSGAGKIQDRTRFGAALDHAG